VRVLIRKHQMPILLSKQLPLWWCIIYSFKNMALSYALQAKTWVQTLLQGQNSVSTQVIEVRPWKLFRCTRIPPFIFHWNSINF
jgi:hypothetical protein